VDREKINDAARNDEAGWQQSQRNYGHVVSGERNVPQLQSAKRDEEVGDNHQI